MIALPFLAGNWIRETVQPGIMAALPLVTPNFRTYGGLRFMYSMNACSLSSILAINPNYLRKIIK